MKTDQLIRVAAIALLAIGCVLVLLPFFTAALLAMVICLSTWPLFAYLRGLLRGNRSGAAGLMTLLLILLFVVPIAILAVSAIENFPKLAELVTDWFERGPPDPPLWLKTLPWIGTWLDDYWHQVVASRDELVKLLQRGLEPTRVLLVGAGKALGQGLLQMIIAVFIAFFFYRDGDRLVDAIRRTLDRVAGALSGEVLDIIEGTVRGVIFGILGTAFAQGVVAAIGFAIASVPAPIALGALVALVSLVPGGPPIVWVGATLWLVSEDRMGWAIFMAVWGLVVISGIDNVVRPLLISRGSSMPILLILLGVFGGLVAFGFVGLFIGPVLLAVGYTLLRRWAGLDVPLLAEPNAD
jgi:predicted PurR-regulated permease PerM